ncbi:ras-related protein Rab-36 isoform X11 [Homo sapiens]|uniref:ras-related protein Rab-36 isoform X11 n=1 Tax=Homo sapiens TaxID=9606 RepID=UPI0007DC7499|nr:ras-related protein Rab-36 isoform X11 [Homo sapiens]XP_047297577.1 ras-related protein Rab-36 isoform X11 [Homo sapiens]XP_054182144.1 ras-related protein Rab-36 isoform X11 [Homo sapiens]|eukprot:XP_016884596.1 ras-related protein Rab-36 isoform X9 [Homo sapiens]
MPHSPVSGTRRKPVCSSGSTSTGRSALPANAGTRGLSGSNSPRWWWLAISTWGRPASSTGFARMFLIETTRPPLGWTLKLSALRLLGFPIASRLIITAFDLTDVQTLEHTRQWLEDALRENEAGSCFIFLVGTKKDLLSGAACEQAEADAVHLAREMQAEYWREREGILQPRSRPGIRAVGAAGPGEAEQCPAPGRQWRPNPNGRESARDPGEQEALQPGLLLTGACVEGLRSLHTHGQEFP